MKHHQKLFKHIHKKGLDRIAYLIIGVTLLTGLPQAIEIFVNESAEDVSVFTWVGYSFIALFWLWYGLERKVKPVIVSSLAYLTIDVSVVVGIIKYGNIL